MIFKFMNYTKFHDLFQIHGIISKWMTFLKFGKALQVRQLFHIDELFPIALTYCHIDELEMPNS